MIKNELKIEVPQGMVIDTEKSNLANGIIKFKPKEKQFPKTWDEFCEQNRYIKAGESFISQSSGIKTYDDYDIVRDNVLFKNVLPDKETAEAMLALGQLIQLRDCYNGGGKPDWSNYREEKHVIFRDNGYICKDRLRTLQCVLNFKTTELRDQFLENFRDLIEIAKPLI